MVEPDCPFASWDDAILLNFSKWNGINPYVCPMSDANEVARTIARHLLNIRAIRLQADHPFTWASGWKSPVYCDNRVSLSYPEIRSFISHELASSIEKNFDKPDLIAGVATAAIAQGALVADRMKLPFVYVRSSPKDHGRQNLIEGEAKPGQKTVVIEDLVSTGQSSLKAVEALRAAGCEVLGLVSVFSYGFEQAKSNFKQANCPVLSLCDYQVMLEEAVASKYIRQDEVTLLEEWRKTPETWGKQTVK